MFMLVHRAYTIKHTFLPNEHLPMMRVGPGPHTHPSPELVALDTMLRAGMSDVIPPPAQQREDIKKLAVLCESHEVPEEAVQHIVVEESQQEAWWVHWPGIDNSSAAPTIIYLHGGGRVAGSGELLLGFLYKLSLSAGARVLAADYSLGPETSILRAVDDAVAAYRHVLAAGVPPSAVFVAGESGGGLMASLLLHAIRDRGLPQPSGGWIISPQADLSVSLPSHTENGPRDAMINSRTYPDFVPSTIGDSSLNPQDPRVSPLFADWSDLPPLLFSVSENEILRDDALECERRAREAGTATVLDLAENAPHAYPLFTGYAPEADAGFQRGAWFIQQSLASARAQ
eukprot:TRINITY_DN7494_c0_g1_i1.p1 TRINITY_DN7494_c0_g1~~TRINITY_DN7494_c0_g1_i1.p1  ORF type:complete len:384 (+),score=128.87 TRINITY_DN7494_c0_g1_i1:125-1153(+)